MQKREPIGDEGGGGDQSELSSGIIKHDRLMHDEDAEDGDADDDDDSRDLG